MMHYLLGWQMKNLDVRVKMSEILHSEDGEKEKVMKGEYVMCSMHWSNAR